LRSERLVVGEGDCHDDDDDDVVLPLDAALP
jgi:hypothetical protein